jgi:hypothetical protein
MKTKDQRYDIIGDIHGHADALRALLAKLGYAERDGAYRHPERSVIFVGDFIDRGLKIRETLQIVRAMVKEGTALAVMGNHEYNAICFHTPDGNSGHLRPHIDKNVKQHQATLDQIATPHPAEWEEWLKWFKDLPLFLDLGGLRVVHACWDEDQIAFLEGNKTLTDKLLHASAVKGTPEYVAIETLLKGKEVELPDGQTFMTKDGVERHEIRVKWWIPGAGRTYRDLSLPTYDSAPNEPVPALPSLARGYGESEPPVFVGHYWLPPAKPERLARNVACVDYSVAKHGPLVAYRWDGEAALNGKKFVSVAGVPRSTVPDVPGQDAEDHSFPRKTLTRKNWISY